MLLLAALLLVLIAAPAIRKKREAVFAEERRLAISLVKRRDKVDEARFGRSDVRF